MKFQFFSFVIILLLLVCSHFTFADKSKKNKGWLKRDDDSLFSNPWHELMFLQKKMDDLFASFRNPWHSTDLVQHEPLESLEFAWKPLANVYETKDGWKIHAEIPGVKKENIHLEMLNKQLILTAERSKEEEIEGGTWHKKEMTYGVYKRVFSLPENAEDNLENIKAIYKDGILDISIPKLESSKSHRKLIPIIEEK